jgi:hypothetical protein
MEGDVSTGRADRLGGETVQQICGSVEPFYPVVSQNRINGTENALGFTVLRRSV